MTEKGTIKPKWNGLGARLLTAIIVVLICMVPFYFGGYLWAALVLLFSCRMMFEWVRMTDPKGSWPALIIAQFGLVIALIYAAQNLPVWALGSMIFVTVIAAVEGARRDVAGWAAVGLPYIIIPSIVIILLRGDAIGFDTRGFTQLVFIILIVIAADVGAYFGGSTFKGPKLAPALSPNKTWSGVLSGLFFASLIAMVVGKIIGLSLSLSVALAIPLVILSVLGDLLESSVKRRIGIKDTGSLLPGHGGLLDRLDSLMAAVIGGAILFLLIGESWPIA